MDPSSDPFPWPHVPHDPIELTLWVNALADRTPAGELLRSGLGDLLLSLAAHWEIRAKA